MEGLIYQLGKDLSKMIGRMLRYFLNVGDASLDGRVGQPSKELNRKIYPLYLTLTPGTWRSEFDQLTTNGTLYRYKTINTEEYLQLPVPGEKLPNPFVLSLTIRPADNPLKLKFFIEPAAEGPTEITISGKTKETITWRQSL
ncbi:hypothetical protein [uncultured Parasutterella sp.]|uniref:hypothetical protein n=1 Tax=uncultured Parasutterella sp. TaxID=1263098 RepID=UPI002594CA2C|nr:hypothetical protein [uncultured Parasutterella sp.]